MLKQFRYIILICILLLGTHKVSAQLEMPDSVCKGAIKHYNVSPNPIPGSIFSWRINGLIQQNSTTNEIDILWNTSGNYLLEVEELSADGCAGSISSGLVIVSPGPIISCTENIIITSNTTVIVPNPMVSDYCSIASIINDYNGTDNASGNYPPGSTMVTFTVTDVYGNSSACTSIISVICELAVYNDTYFLAINSSNNLPVSSNDSLCGELYQNSSITILNQLDNPTFTVSPIAGQIIFTPQPGYTGTDSVQYEVCFNYDIINDQGDTENYMVCDSAWIFVHISPLPTAHIAGSATICNSGLAILVLTMTGSPPFTVQVFDGNQVNTYSGIMFDYFTIMVSPSVTTTYTITQVQDATTLTAVGTGSAVITVFGPQAFILTGGGNFCPGSPGLNIGLTGSEVGIIYTLYLNGSSISGPVSGTGDPLNFGMYDLPGVYTVIASSPTYYCTFPMYSNVIITQFPAPISYEVTGGGDCCFGCTNISVGLSNSDQGVWYQLYLNDTILISSGYGTGGPIDFGYVTESGFYTVLGYNTYGCMTIMTGQANVIIWPRPDGNMISPDQTICQGNSGQLIIELVSGTAPWHVDIFNGTNTLTYYNILCSPYIITIDPTITTTYTLTSISDTNNCSGLFGGSTTITVNSCGSSTISGHITYENTINSPMDNTTVSLLQNNTVIAVTNTNISGFYQFPGLSTGTYNIEASTNKPWYGSNATDALLIMKHFTGSQYLAGLSLNAANIDNQFGVNAIDALAVAKRYVQLINYFPAGDWIFENDILIVNNTDLIHDFKALCYGDVNGSYQPPSSKIPATMNLSTSGTFEVLSLSDFEIPIRLSESLTISSLSMIMTYPSAVMDVVSVTVSNQKTGETQFNTIGDQLRISWYDVNQLSLSAHDDLLRIQFRTKDISKLKDGNIDLALDGTSEVSDIFGQNIPEVNLTFPRLILPVTELQVQVYPNPVNYKVEFRYTIPENARVSLILYDILGREIKTLLYDIAYQSGTYRSTFEVFALPQGVYNYKFIAQGKTEKQQTGRLLITR